MSGYSGSDKWHTGRSSADRIVELKQQLAEVEAKVDRLKSAGHKLLMVTPPPNDAAGALVYRDCRRELLGESQLKKQKPVSKWDYRPQIGDIIYVRGRRHDAMRGGDKPFEVTKVTDAGVYAHGLFWSFSDYQFAKAEVSPPPGEGE